MPKLPFSFFFFNKFIILFIYFWLCWVFVAACRLSLVAASGRYSSSRCAGLSLLRPLLLRSTGSRRAGAVVVVHRSSCSAACGVFPDQGSNPCPLHWQADSQPLRHQGSPNQNSYVLKPWALRDAEWEKYKKTALNSVLFGKARSTRAHCITQTSLQPGEATAIVQ